MGTHPNYPNVVRFGSFELDREAGELRKNGVRVPLQEQPVQILATLVERPGRVVTREQLRQRLWADDTFVDFDQGLNRAVNKIREALDDSATNPRFVETMPRRGYRFIYPLEQAAAAQGETTPAAVAVPLAVAASPAAPHRPRRLAWVLAAVAACGALGLATWFLGSTQPQAPLQAIPLTSYDGSERDATFSPNGNQVAFSWDGKAQDNYDIYVKVIGDGVESPRRLTHDSAQDRYPAWSPDGRQIAFTRLSDETETVYLISPTGGPERRVAELLPRKTPIEWSLGNLAWSSDGRSLFLSARDSAGDPFGIYHLPIDTGAMRRLTSPPVGTGIWGDMFAAVGPDGHRLAFVRTTGARSEILRTQVESGGAQQLVAFDGFLMGLAWTANGKEIVASRGHGFNNTLWRVPTLGGTPQQMLTLGESAFHPVISPQGGRLLFERFFDDANIYRYDLSGSPPQAGSRKRLIAGTAADEGPGISPDGTRIAFVSDRSGHEEIWICDRDGSNALKLTAYAGTSRPGKHTWSPDGTHIAFDCYASGNSDVLVINSEGGSSWQLTTHAASDSRPFWSHDGKWIYFNSNRSGRPEIWKAPAGGGDAVQLTQGGGYHPVESADGKFVYYAQQQFEPGIWRVPVEGGEEICVLPSVSSAWQGRWDVVDEGIYFLDIEAAPSRQGNWSLKFFDFGTGQTTRVAELGQPEFPWGPLNVSPDGTWLLLAEIDHGGTDLMLVEDFR